jgi:hypothetical protein
MRVGAAARARGSRAARLRFPVGAWRSLVAHLPWAQGVAGSNPVAPTTFLIDFRVITPRRHDVRAPERRERAVIRQDSPDQYRICFVWRDGDADDVEIVDCH